MAVKRRVKEIEEIPGFTGPVEEVVAEKPAKKKKWLVLAIVVIGGLALFWYKTNTWPIVAMVGMRPITRLEVDQALYKQGGASVVDEIVTQVLVENALKKEGVKVTKEELDTKVSDIEKTLGEQVKLADMLKSRGMEMKDFLNQLKLQMGVQKALESKISVTKEEIDSYIKDNGGSMAATNEAGRVTEAQDNLKVRKLQEEIVKWIEGLRIKAKIWYGDKNLKLPSTGL